MEAYVHGVSTHSVDDLVEAMGGTGISKSEVSRVCAGLDENRRRVPHPAPGPRRVPYIDLAATYLHVRNHPGKGGQVVPMAVVVATGVTAAGEREILGLDVGDSEDEIFWRSFLLSLKQRGLCGVRLVISDQHAGLVKALNRAFQGVAHQRCRVHFARNLLAYVPKGQVDYVAAAFRMIFTQPKPADIDAAWDKTRDELAVRWPKFGPLHGRGEGRGPRLHRLPQGARARSGPPTRASGSTRRSSAAAGSWASFPTPPPSSGWSARS